MKPYQHIKIIECHQPLVPIPDNEFILENPSAYVKLGADYQGKSPYFLREEVLKRLLKAKAKLAQIKPHWQIKIFDAYRPVNVQQFMVDYTFNSICCDRQLDTNFLTPWEKASIYEEVYQIWAIPSDNPLTPPPHSTGSAIDLTLIDENGVEINMGGEIDELSERSNPNYYSKATNEQEQKYHENRQILLEIMTYSGFRRHLGEWWHFSYGDQMWAWLEDYNLSAIAKYGTVGINGIHPNK
ncbi:MAG: D-alanyl-D-alanine dipeptidase [Cyanobacteria bacterium]|nr:D-alanyl-D-alanine dipeptidase [Cyanobacteria bacterium CG_2015-16_32_12]NCO77083.1 D-alanyl-D-alanine dipeptidase [Cyanobacteria bacterium CG_2015-22_32_23]NCQ03760.1 D-alanyl-D-alanine dipeptidase [Cyanobacteria bacterium CG_2015-09_32_10]NCQ40764.1 D-alanyl-D-alanine dipeptidase [Cyanobacteria bacterium CG_2015-04_32_10]NCS85239.1 D-alanyl-D-alanine dipeptidase [Cyanobacteria bacterium CG_2015-02_32_10]